MSQIESQPGQAITADHAETLIRQGSVWFGNVRIKNPETNVQTLFNPVEKDQAIQKRRSGHAGRAAKKAAATPHDKPAASPPSDDPDLQDMRYGPWLQVFYPEKPITEYSLNSSHIKYEDQDLLIVYKEAMINTCQSVFSDSNCLTWGVQKYLDGQAKPGEGYHVNTINRLDYATRGLVFYAKHKTAEVALHKMFMNRHIHKRYLVLTPDFTLPSASDLAQRTPPDGIIRGGADSRGGFSLKINDSLDWNGKFQKSCTLIRLVGRNAATGQMVWIALPQTGRTHQIRKHFARYLVPIQGDPVYGPELYLPDDDLMLACISYRFRHPISGKTMRVKYLPTDMGLETIG